MGVEAPAPATATSRRAKTSASLSRFSAFNTILTSEEGEIRT